MLLFPLRLRTWLALTLLPGLVLIACSEKATDVQPKTVTDLLIEKPEYSTLKAAVTYAGLGDALKATNLTLFAPSDVAFAASNVTAASLLALPKDSVKKIVLYHVLFGQATTATIPVGSNAVTTAQNQATAYLTKTSTDVFINNARITTADQVVANGVVHTVSRLLAVPAGSVVDVARRDPSLSFLLIAATRAATASPDLLTTLSITPITVFAPTNAAFVAAGYSSAASINQASPQTLAALLSYHILRGVSFSTQLTPGTVTTLSQGTNNRLTIGATATGITVKGNQNATAATIQQADITTSNGVVHKIDQLLRP